MKRGPRVALSQQLPAGIGPAKQVCFITDDIPATARRWSTMFGVGPFFHIEHVPLENVHYRGTPINLDISVGLANWGELQIELIHQHNDVPSVFADWVNGKRHGPHHVAVQTQDVQQTRGAFHDAGALTVQTANLPGGGEYMFYDMNSADVPFVEVIRLPQVFMDIFRYIRKAADGWDGTDPLRNLPADVPSE